MKKEPIKRHKLLQPLSREHHHALLLCWKIRKGFAKGVDAERIKKYADWFFQNHIGPHFEIEEQFMFPVLGQGHPLVKKALSEHRRLKRLFSDQKEIQTSLSLIEEELEQHVRFEERTLFNEIQENATKQELETIDKVHREGEFQENMEDEFWK